MFLTSCEINSGENKKLSVNHHIASCSFRSHTLHQRVNSFAERPELQEYHNVRFQEY